MKILFLSYTFAPKIGGIETNSDLLAKNFQALGHEVVLVTEVKAASPNDELASYNIIRSPTPRKLFALYSWADIVFHNNPSLNLAYPGIFIKKPTVIAVRTWIRRNDTKIGIRDLLKRLFIKLATNRIYISKAIAEDCGFSGEIIGNPYNSGLYKTNKRFEARNKKLLFVGRLVDSKGVETLLQALPQIKNLENNDVTIVGVGPEQKNYLALSRKLNLENIVDFVGAKSPEDLVNIYNDHRFHIIPSLWAEPFGNVALEGIACGCVCIATENGGLKDAVGECGILFENGSSIQLAEAVNKLMMNSKLTETILAAGPSHLTSHLEQTVAKKYLEVLTASYAKNTIRGRL
ncbi:MAG: glycosyltransferase family 4 protein [Polaromonas sp.]|nr:glycosyltransferase family 4 protein [Polaromonas sp.]